IAEAYMDDQRQALYDAAQETIIWLQGKVNELQALASAAELEVNRFKAENNIVEAGGQNLNDFRLAQAANLVTARDQAAETLRLQLGQVTQALASGNIQAMFSFQGVISPMLSNLWQTRNQTLQNNRL